MPDAPVFLVSVRPSQLWREITNVRRSTCKDLLSVSDFNPNRNAPTNFTKNSNIKFRANLSSGNLVVPRARIDGRTDSRQTWHGNVCFDFIYNICPKKKNLILRRTEPDMIINVHIQV